MKPATTTAVSRKTARKQARIDKKQKKSHHFIQRKTHKKQQERKRKLEIYGTDRKTAPAVEKITKSSRNVPKRRKPGQSIISHNVEKYSEVYNDPLLAFADRALDAGILGSDGEFDEDKMNGLFASSDGDIEQEEEEMSIDSEAENYLRGEPEASLDEAYSSRSEASSTESDDDAIQVKSLTKDATESVDNAKLQKIIHGHINRLTLSNFDCIAKLLVDLFQQYSRHEVTELVVSSILNSVTKQANLLDSFLTTFAALISAMAHFTGIDLVGSILERCVAIIDEQRLIIARPVNPDLVPPEKIIANCVTLIAFLYDLRVVSSIPILNLIEEAVDQMKELDVEILVKLIRTCGAQLRRDDPGSLKTIISKIMDRIIDIPVNNQTSRFKFMVETIQDLKNNRQKLVAIQHGELESAKKILRNFLLTNNKAKLEPLAVGLKDIRDVKVKGKWWKIGAAWNPEGGEETKREEIAKNIPASGGDELLQIAKRQKMNTDVRRIIFTTLMSSDDYLDAFQRLISLKLPSRQEREIAHVLLHCCTSEKLYNPFYALVANKFADLRHNFVITFKYALWDRLKQIEADELKLRELLHIAKFYGLLFARGALPLACLKRASFAQLSDTGVIFFQTLFAVFFEKVRDETMVVVSISKLKDVTAGGKAAERKEDIFGSEDEIENPDDGDDSELAIRQQELTNLRSGLRLFLKQFLRSNIDTLPVSNPNLLMRLMGVLLRFGRSAVGGIRQPMTFGWSRIISMRSLHQSKALFGLGEFFENGKSLPPFDPAAKQTYGRAWDSNEIRLKSFEDLHKLWFVLLKEMNLLATQKAEAARMGQRWFGMHRVHKTILTERAKIHSKASQLVTAVHENHAPPQEGELVVNWQRQDKLRQLKRKRKFRQRINYRTRRPSLFV
ncbi:hypothetical protein PSACC_00881 [Paramicrosporidium saccamoebae]|uniref:54S ribosomal protein L4, mitochondrial n=1 Tax=Paramicrosporidium saccamoebae TaxID=1246581 RepID=A0A2H9TNS7_9FUNG|nr:hypothetical protein PSACC_00881 [Paramicrosporidium saccamoebae]